MGRGRDTGGCRCVCIPLTSPPSDPATPTLYLPAGPTEESNWVIHQRLLVGAYPSDVHDATNTKILTSILKLGVTTFVCLQSEYQHEGVSEAEWRSGAKLRPYIFDAIRLVDSLPPSFFPPEKGKPSGLDFVHFPINGQWRARTIVLRVRVCVGLTRNPASFQPRATIFCRLLDCKRRECLATRPGSCDSPDERRDHVSP